MKKGISVALGTVFIITIIIGGCNKPEEKKVEAPLVEKQMVEDKAPAVKLDLVEKTEKAAEKAIEETETMTGEAAEAVKEEGQEVMESTIEKMQEEVKESSGGQMEKETEEGLELPAKN